jgi:hypothetical protein
MAGKHVPVVFLPRFTTLVGGPQNFYTAPMPISSYEGVTATFWQGPFVGGPAACLLQYEESNDMETWFQCPGSPFPLPGVVGEVTVSSTLTRAWFRLGIVQPVPATGFTCWVEGFFELREK